MRLINSCVRIALWGEEAILYFATSTKLGNIGVLQEQHVSGTFQNDC